MRKFLDTFTAILVLVGALNWGLIGAFDFNIVIWLFGMATIFMKLVYILIGFSAVYQIIRRGVK
jgi:uncharacterized membrane protein YuzA (DUF378 family)